MATSNTYDKGDLVRVRGSFDSDGVAVDPATVVFKYKTPAGAMTTLTYGVDTAVVRDSTGNYHVDVNANAVGTWYYRWESTGTYQAASEGTFMVRTSNF